MYVQDTGKYGGCNRPVILQVIRMAAKNAQSNEKGYLKIQDITELDRN